jgi:two-component system KDP operon response regulator KdpE
MTRVLVVDDDRAIRRALTLNLAQRGYEVVQADSGEAAMQAAAVEHPDVILLDLGLPGVDGIEVIAAVRGWSSVPIIVLTARDDERSKVAALDAGADDYVTKPFGMAELLARLRAAVRRATPVGDDIAEVRTDAFDLDLAAHRATRHGAEVKLTPTEWSIVTYLVRNSGRLVAHRQLLNAVWGPSYDPDPTLLRVHLGHIRRKLEADPARPQHFITESGAGYRFDPEPITQRNTP